MFPSVTLSRTNAIPGAKSRGDKPLDSSVYWLSLLPVVDVCINQVGQWRMNSMSSGSLSVFQAIRGSILVVMLLYSLSIASWVSRCHPRAVRTVLGGILLFGTFSVIECVDTGRVSLLSVVGYVQIVYWLLSLVVALHVYNTPRAALVGLKGLCGAAGIAAISVIGVYVMNLGIIERGAYVSNGGFGSPKGVAGILVVGGVLIAVVWRRSQHTLSVLAGVVCTLTVFLTYSRSGIVATLLCLLCGLGFTVRYRQKRQEYEWLRKYALLYVVLFSSLAGLLIGLDGYQQKMGDFTSRRTAGSGRLAIWDKAVDIYSSTTWDRQLLGHGYKGMFREIGKRHGVAIHTHNDCLDMLLVGGVSGIVFMVSVVACFYRLASDIRVGTIEQLLVWLVFIVFLVQSSFSGQFFLPDTMAFYVVAVVCLRRLGVPSRKPFVW